jgi:hypothetical protein
LIQILHSSAKFVSEVKRLNLYHAQTGTNMTISWNVPKLHFCCASLRAVRNTVARL